MARTGRDGKIAARMVAASALGVAVAGVLAALVARALMPAYAPPEDAHPYVVDGLVLHAVDEGPRRAARTVVLLHGTPGSIDDWVPVRDALRGRYRVVTVERPGMGWSDPPATAAEYSLGTHATRIAGVLAQLDVREPIVVGWSYGGAVALRMAIDRPELPAGVVHLCGVAPGFVDALRHGRHANLVQAGVFLELPVLGRWISDWIVPPLLSLVGAASWLEPQFGPDWPRVPSHWIARRLRSLQTRHALRSSRREIVNLSADLAALGPRLGEIRRPVCVVVCELDNLVPGHLSDRLVAMLPDARKVTVPGAGHSFHVVRPHELGQVIDAFASEIE